jgi:hypothetical protein
MPKRKMTLDPELAAEAKSLVALAFRNGPIEDVHAGKLNSASRVTFAKAESAALSRARP